MNPWALLGTAAAVAGALWWTYTEGKDAGASEAAATFARAQQIAIEARDAEQARITKEQQDAAIRADKARDAAEVARAAAVDAVGRLRQRAADVAARACGPSAAPLGEAEGGPVVLADVLGRLAEAGGRAAAAADDARNRGDECAARYDALTRPR